MRLLFLILSSVLALIPFKASCQDFGCYSTPGGNSDIVFKSKISPPSSISLSDYFNNFKLDSAIKDGYDTIYYKTRPWFPKQVKMIGEIVNGKQEGKWLLYGESPPFSTENTFYT